MSTGSEPEITAVLLTSDERLAIERVITACCIDREEALLLACQTLPLKPFRSHEADYLHRVFYWAVSLHGAGTFNGLRNRERLLFSMDRALYPQGWSHEERDGWIEFALAWNPIMYNLGLFGDLCEQLRDDLAATERLVEVHSNFRQSQAVSVAQRTPQAPAVDKPMHKHPRGGVS